MKLDQKWEESKYITMQLQRCQVQSAVELARNVTLSVCKAVYDSHKSKASKDTKTNAKDVLAEGGRIFEELLLQNANTGSRSAVQNMPPRKHLLALPPSLLNRLRYVYEKIGTTDDVFDESQRREVTWLSDTIDVRDMMMELYGKPRSKP